MCPQRLKIRIQRPLNEVVITRNVERDGASVLIWKQRGERPEWKLHFDRSCIFRTRRFPFGTRDTLEAFPYADHAISKNFEAQEENQPIYDRETEDKLVRSKVLEELGEGDKAKIHPLMWIIFIMVLLSILVNFFQYWSKLVGGA